MSEVISKNKFFKEIGYEPHPKQQLYHASMARFRVPCCGRRFGKSIMAARDLEPELFLPNRRYWIVGPCVDEATEILTERGWLTYKDLLVGDSVLTLNAFGAAEWQPVEKVNIHTGAHELIHIKQRGHDSMTTPNHRWLVGYITQNTLDGSKRTLGYRFVTTETMTKSNEFVTGGADVINLPEINKYKDAFVELVGWYWTEGTDQQQGNGILITQNAGVNADRIRAAACLVFGNSSSSSQMRNRYDTKARWSDWKPIKGQESCGRFGFNSQAGEKLRRVAPDKVISPSFIVDLTKAQLELLIDISVRADGHERNRGAKGRERIVVQKRFDRLSALQMACQLAGYQTTLRFEGPQGRWVLAIFERSKMWLGQKPAVNKRIKIHYVGDVWCPTTQNGTWLARRNGTVYFTGNSYDLGEKEFRIIWHDLIIGQQLGKNKSVKRAYSAKQGNMHIEFPWGTRVEVRSASHPENLVGDGLHGVILSEAAKHSEDTWERYLRPALADYRGWASFVSTPEGQNWYHKIWQYGQNPSEEYKDYVSWRFPSWENRILYPEGRNDSEILQIELTTSTEWFEQEIGADFTAFVGKIYHEFQESTHVKKCEYNPVWKNVMVWDWGFVHPLACIEFQIDPWDNIYVWREHYGSYKILEDHIAEIKARPNPQYYKIDYCFGDAADPGAAATVTQHLTPCWVDPAAKSGKGESGDAVWREGVELVKKFLKMYETGETDEYGTPMSVPKLFVDHSCVNTIREFNNYKAKQPPRNSRNRSSGRDMAQDWDNNCLDALRYGLVHMYKLGAQHSLGEAMPGLTGNYSQSNTIFKPSDFEF